MSSQAFVSVVVVSPREDDAEAISQTLRNSGCAARCHWLQRARDLPAALQETAYELMFVATASDDFSDIAQLCEIRDKLRSDLPVIALAMNCDDEAIGQALTCGANDLVSLSNRVRLGAVALRELRHCKGARELASFQASAAKLTTQLDTLVKESPDAIMLVQEGIVVHTNPAWGTMMGYSEPDDMVGTPALDVFAEAAHTAIKGAMAGCNNGKWAGHSLEVKALGSDGGEISVEAQFEASHYDDEPCVRVSLTLDVRKDDASVKQIVASGERHPLTGFFRRQRFLNEMEKKLNEPSRGGIWVLAYVKPDAIAELREQVGPLSSDDLLLEFARILQDNARKNDIYGQFGGDLFMVLMPRGTARDAHAWAENFRQAVAARLFDVAEKSLTITCSIGLARFTDDCEDLADLILKAQKSYQIALKEGGNHCHLPRIGVGDDVHQKGDTAYVQQIKSALMKDNFRLVFQPVANLSGQSQQMFDVLIRMIDNNREMMPGTFLPAAKRNGLMKNIDRWVISNALRFCKEQKPAGLFIRLSAESVPDKTLVAWIEGQVRESGADPRSLIFQITETDTEARLRDVKELSAGLKSLNCQVALEHFGLTQQPLQILEHVPLDYLKIDGSLMEGIATDKRKQDLVRGFIEAASEKHISTVAERVEDANTMAVLWQLGIEFIQGFYVQGPEEIVLESA